MYEISQALKERDMPLSPTARRMRSCADAHARHIFRDHIDTPADVSISAREAHLHLHRRAHLPISIASGIPDSSVKVRRWHNHTLRVSG